MEAINDAILQAPVVDLRTQQPTPLFGYYLRAIQRRAVTTAVVTVNTTGVQDANFSNTLPAAPAGGVNVTWLVDASVPANVSAHLPANSVSNTVLRDSPATSVVGNAALVAGDPGDIVAGTNTVLARVAGVLGFIQIVTALVENGAVTNPKLAAMATGTLKGGGSSGQTEDLEATDTDTITWDFTTPGEVKATIPPLDTGWSATNVTTTKTFDADTVTLAALADVVGTLVQLLLSKNILDP